MNPVEQPIVPIRQYNPVYIMRTVDGYIINIPETLRFYLLEFLNQDRLVTSFEKAISLAESRLRPPFGSKTEKPARKSPLMRYYQGACRDCTAMRLESARKAEAHIIFWQKVLLAVKTLKVTLNEWENSEGGRKKAVQRLKKNLLNRQVPVKDAYLLYYWVKEYWLQPMQLDDDDEDGEYEKKLEPKPEKVKEVQQTIAYEEYDDLEIDREM